MRIFIEYKVRIETQNFTFDSEILESDEIANGVASCLENNLTGNENEEEARKLMNHCMNEYKKHRHPKLEHKPQSSFRLKQ